MQKVVIQGEGSDKAVVRDQGLLVSVLPYPPTGVPNNLIPFVGSLTVNGDGATSDLRVDGSVTPIDAFVGPPITGDLYLTTANILISDNGVVALNRFGGIGGGLTNGIDIFVETENSRFAVANSLKSNFDLIRLGTLTQGTGGKTDAYLLANTNAANEDGYNPVLDFTKVSPLGVRLRKDTLDKLGITINDDLTSLGTFDIIINGYVRV